MGFFKSNEFSARAVLILFLSVWVAYGNTLTHDYTQDDAIVIYDNMYTQQGIKGIPGLLTKDTFFGFFKTEGKDKLVAGGRYRPLTPVMFAIENEIFGQKPFWGHFFNVLWYAVLVVLLFKTLQTLLESQLPQNDSTLIAFFAALIYALHPVHTEAVANIKGRDEIMSLLLSLTALYLIISKSEKPRILTNLGIGLAFFAACLAKENAATFLIVIPLALWMFYGHTIRELLVKSWPIWVAFVLFLVIRTSILGSELTATSFDLMNNPFLKIVGGQYVPFTFSEKMATVFFTLYKYIQLFVFPLELTHDYYPRHIPLLSWTEPTVLIGVLLYTVLFIFALLKINKYKIPVFGILFYLCTLSIVSNILFPIGTNMSERFLFMPSAGLALVVGWSLHWLYKKNKMNGSAVLVIIALLFGLKTIDRNRVWKDDFTLFTTDVHTSKNSAKVLNAAAGALSSKSYELEEGERRTDLLTQARAYAGQAIEIHPNYKNAHLILGNAEYFLKNYEAAITAYKNALNIDPNYAEARKNLAIALRDFGRKRGEIENDLSGAEALLLESMTLDPTDAETLRLLGIVYGISGNHTKAIEYFEKNIAQNPNNAGAYLNLANALSHAGRTEDAQKMQEKALSIDPDILTKK